MRRIRTIAKRTASLVSGLAVLAAIAYGVLMLAGYRPVVVYTGSMEPSLSVGSLAFLEKTPSSTLQKGDVITFTDPYQPGRLVTHRIAQTIERPAGRAYRTKGDANPARDPWTISLPAQAAQVAFDLPLAGYILWYSKTREVRSLLVFGVALTLLASVLRTIWRKQPAKRRTA
jgi:signal peptidase